MPFLISKQQDNYYCQGGPKFLEGALFLYNIWPWGAPYSYENGAGGAHPHMIGEEGGLSANY